MLEAEEELLEEGVRPYLAKYGFLAADADTWSAPDAAGDRGPRPTLELSVTGHEEREGHTWYVLDCRLAGPTASARPLRWRADRRLAQLRELLHDRVKLELGGPAYEQCFSGAPFAHKGGVRGTTARLQGWCAALASGVSSGTCPPSVVGLTLQFLEAPEPLSLTGAARASASSAAARVRGTLGAAAGAVRQRFEQVQTQAAEQASTTAMGFAATNPKAAKAASGMAMGFAKQNPEAAKAAGQLGAKAAFGCMRSSPAATMSVLKATARGASAVF